MVSETAGQKYSALLCLHSMLTTLNSLITAETSNLVAVGFGLFFLFFDITEWPYGSELGFQILINAACHSNGND